MAHDDEIDSIPGAPLGGTRAQAVQRLQVGIFGLGSMILLIGLAQIIFNQAREAEAGIVPEAASTVAPAPTQSQPSDPLADAGVGPDLPNERQQQQPQPAATTGPDARLLETD